MEEQQPAAETELTTINNTDEVADGPPSSPESERDEQPLNKSGNSICETHHHHHKWLWLHAAFHCLVTIVVRLKLPCRLQHIPSFLCILTHISTSFLSLGNGRSWIPIRHILVGIWWRSCPNYRRCFICLLHSNTPFKLTRTRSKDVS